MALYPMETYLNDTDLLEYRFTKGKQMDRLNDAWSNYKGYDKESPVLKHVFGHIDAALKSLENHQKYLHEKPRRGIKYNTLVAAAKQKKEKLAELMEQVKPLEKEIGELEEQIKALEDEEAEHAKWYLSTELIPDN